MSKRQNIDVPLAHEALTLSKIGETLDAALILATKVEMLAQEGADFNDIQETVVDEINELDDSLGEYIESAIFTVSGKGFLPVFNYAEDTTDTAYANANSARGRYDGISLIHPDDFNYMCQSDDDDDYATEDGSDIALLEDDEYSLNSPVQLLPPPLFTRLYIEFLTHHSSESERLVGGVSVRSYNTAYYNVMDVLGLNVEHVEIENQESLLYDMEIVDAMLDEARKMQKIQRGTRFRRTKIKGQVEEIDSRVNSLNSRLGLDRVSMVVNTDSFYMPISTDNDRNVKRVSFRNTQIHMKPVRVDSIDSYEISGGARVHDDSGLVDVGAGLYLVGGINEALADHIGLGSTIIWVPLADKNQMIL